MKITLTILLFANLNLLGQTIKNKDLEGYWVAQTQDEIPKDRSDVYSFYKENTLISVLNLGDKIIFNQRKFGFYDDCYVLNLNSLKNSGNYYFELDSNDFEGNKGEIKSRLENSCNELSIHIEGEDIIILIYSSSRQQFARYRKINMLPANIIKFLQSKGVEVNSPKQETKITLTVKSPKALIYTEPNKPSKMYLLKDDIVTVLQEKDNWLYILYVTNKNKEIKGWIKKEDVSSK